MKNFTTFFFFVFILFSSISFAQSEGTVPIGPSFNFFVTTTTFEVDTVDSVVVVDTLIDSTWVSIIIMDDQFTFEEWNWTDTIQTDVGLWIISADAEYDSVYTGVTAGGVILRDTTGLLVYHGVSIILWPEFRYNTDAHDLQLNGLDFHALWRRLYRK